MCNLRMGVRERELFWKGAKSKKQVRDCDGVWYWLRVLVVDQKGENVQKWGVYNHPLWFRGCRCGFMVGVCTDF